MAEVRSGEGEAPLVGHLGGVLDPGAILAPELVAPCTQAPRRAVDHVDGAGARDRSDAFQRSADREVSVTISPEVRGRDGPAELVAGLGDVLDPGAVLGEELVALRSQALAGAVDHVHRSGGVRGAHGLRVGADRQVGVAVAAQIPRSQRPSQPVAALGGVLDPGAVLAPEAGALG